MKVAIATAIRPATEADIPALVRLAVEFSETSEYRNTLGLASPERVTGLCQLVLSGDLPSTIFVADAGDGLVGFLAVAVFAHPYTEEQIADELAWFVLSSQRGQRAGVQLLDAAEAWAAERHVRLKLSAPAGSRVGAYLEARGYRAIETTYMRVA